MSEEQPKRYRGQRGPNKVPRPRMLHVTMRLPQHVVDFYGGSSTVMRHVLTRWAEGALAPRDDRTT